MKQEQQINKLLKETKIKLDSTDASKSEILIDFVQKYNQIWKDAELNSQSD